MKNNLYFCNFKVHKNCYFKLEKSNKLLIERLACLRDPRPQVSKNISDKNFFFLTRSTIEDFTDKYPKTEKNHKGSRVDHDFSVLS